MKKILFFLLASISMSAQKTEKIDLSKSIKDSKKTYKNFTVIDQRASPEIGAVQFHKDQVKIAFEKNAASDIKDWFTKYNKFGGGEQLVMVLEKINITEEKKDKFQIGKLDFRASTFIKKEDRYHFLYRKDTAATVSSRDTPYMAQSLAKKLALICADLFKDSYRTTPWEFSLSETELSNYEVLLTDKLDILKTDTLKDGVYKDSYSFFTHKPEPGFTLQTNDKGIVTKAINGEEKKPLRNFYAFVYNGIPYKVILVGYTEIFKNENGLFIEAKKEELFAEGTTSGVVIGAAAGGLVGGLIGAAIDLSATKKRRGIPGSEVVLDPLTGNYILPADFGKSK
ncbi:hypothetical protein LNP04_11165 [Chryseobacterium sp. C-71]|uniref:hypothetical protein n=1 Tax=Chryseobacterium sp. C-71 TaxID=2893882 RepID=UPI001E4581E4|nr:hypothetical protein [Chryseobacterium sp. C-71]UFH30536.1 hypothetical protein LNP04_11165 [Chryseobacterium sp. C-71]